MSNSSDSVLDVPEYPGGESATSTAFQTRASSPEPRPTKAFSPESLAILRAVQNYYDRVCLEKNQSYDSAVGIKDGSKNVATSTKVKYLAAYFVFSLVLTLSNKTIMIEYPFPLLLTAIHIGISYMGTSVMLGQARPSFTFRNIMGYNTVILNGFSTLYALNIAVSNISLSMGCITVPLHQVNRATTPIFTVLIYRIYYRSTYSKKIYLSLVPLVFGVGLSTYGDYNATVFGTMVTLLGAFLAAVKTVATNRVQTAGMHLSALELLHHMSPMAFLQVIGLIFITGEYTAYFAITRNLHDYGFYVVNALLINGLVAFGVNLVSFTANKQAGALTMTVAANVKQVLTVVLSVTFWQLMIGPVNLCGITLTFIGGALYSYFAIPTRDEHYNEDRKASRTRGRAYSLDEKVDDAEYVTSRAMTSSDMEAGKRVRFQAYEDIWPTFTNDCPPTPQLKR